MVSDSTHDPTPDPDTADPVTRNTHVVRDDIREGVRRVVWAKSAGRCTLCNRLLFADALTYMHSVTVGELAHIVGATDTDGSPRGLDELENREDAENLMLLCHECHRLIDDRDHIELWPAEKLRALKDDHERRIEMVTANGGLRRTAVLRVQSLVQGSSMIASRRDVAQVLFEGNFLGLVETEHSGDFTCRINGQESNEGYWALATSTIDRTITRVHQAIEEREVEHLSVFPTGAVPLLVYLGFVLDDKIACRLYQQQRDDQAGWRWVDTAPVIDFEAHAGTTDPEATDVVLTCSVSADVNIERLPTHLQTTAHVSLTPQGIETGPTLFRNATTLVNFGERWRDCLALAESRYPNAQRWHIVAATPVTASVEIGRAIMHSHHPATEIYQRMEGTYVSVIEVNQ